MEVAIIVWGSLIWCPGSLQIRTLWFRNGPLLPVEYARISSDGRLTLVINEASENQTALWAISSSQDIGKAKENLREREGTNSRHIQSGTAAGEFSEGVTDPVRNAIAKWLAVHSEIQGCKWTGLASNWNEKRKCDFSVRDALRYLETLPESGRAREYIQNTPRQIQTEVRNSVRSVMNWQDAELPDVLFEKAGTNYG
jgi:hypothetical protein